MDGYLIVFLGAGVGGALRHGVNIAALRILGADFPYGTVAVNVFGSFAMGVLAAFFALRFDPGHPWRLLVATGILGGFTTFSSFSLDAVSLYERGDVQIAVWYMAFSVVASVLALFSGLGMTRYFLNATA